LAAERGGNSEPSRPDERVIESGVVVLGPTNLPSEIPNHASQMYSNNVARLLLEMVDEDQHLFLDLDDEIINGTLVAHEGVVVNHRVSDLLDATCEEVAGIANVDSQESVGVDDSLSSDKLGDEVTDHISDSVDMEDDSTHDTLPHDHDIDDKEVDESLREDPSNVGEAEDSLRGIEDDDDVLPHDLSSVDDENDDTGEQDLIEDGLESDIEESQKLELMSDDLDDVEESHEDDQDGLSL
jgi:hypothetical protein